MEVGSIDRTGCVVLRYSDEEYFHLALIYAFPGLSSDWVHVDNMATLIDSTYAKLSRKQ